MNRAIDAVPCGVGFDSKAPAYYNEVGGVIYAELCKHYYDPFKRCRPVKLARLRKLLRYQQRVRLAKGL